MNDDPIEGLLYAFGHAVSSYSIDAHSGDSADLAQEVARQVLAELSPLQVFHALAEHVAGDYQYTGEATSLLARIKAGVI